MSQPQFCRNPECPYARVAPTTGWFVRDGTYWCKAHGRVQRYKCKECGRKLSGQTESMHYFAKRRLDLKTIVRRIKRNRAVWRPRLHALRDAISLLVRELWRCTTSIG